jgi:hypothetical protein
MSKWDLQSDLMRLELLRLLEALSDEITASTDRDIVLACVEARWPLAEAAKEVRDLLGVVTGGPGKACIDPFAEPADGGLELEGSQPHRSAAETGGRTCQRQR